MMGAVNRDDVSTLWVVTGEVSPRPGSSIVIIEASLLVLASAFGAAAFAQTHPDAPAIPVPATGAYFGAWANPAGTPGPTAAEVESDTEALETQIGRRLALHMHYYGWGSIATAAPSFPDQAMWLDSSRGRTPVVTWACGDADANVITGADDALINNTAIAIKQFGAPIFLRWYWEMNLAAGTNSQDCLGTTGPAGTVGPAGYVAAWQHIHALFTLQGVTNVTWLWNPGGAATEADPLPYYPGPA